MDNGLKFALILTVVGLSILALLFVTFLTFVWHTFFGETEFDRQYRENLKKVKQYSQPKPSDTEILEKPSP